MGSLTEWTTLQAAFEELLALGPDISVHPLFARLVVASTEEQLKAFQPSTTEWIQIIQALKVPLTICTACSVPLVNSNQLRFTLAAYSYLCALLHQAGPVLAAARSPQTASSTKHPDTEHMQQQVLLAQQFKQQFEQSGLPQALPAAFNAITAQLKAAATDTVAAELRGSSTSTSSTDHGSSSGSSSSWVDQGASYMGLLILADEMMSTYMELSVGPETIAAAVGLAFAALQHCDWAITQGFGQLQQQDQEQEQQRSKFWPYYGELARLARGVMMTAGSCAHRQGALGCLWLRPRLQAAASLVAVVGGYIRLLSKLAPAETAAASACCSCRCWAAAPSSSGSSDNNSAGSSSRSGSSSSSSSRLAASEDLAEAQLAWQIACQHQQQLPALPDALVDMLGVDRLLLAWLAVMDTVTGRGAVVVRQALLGVDSVMFDSQTSNGQAAQPLSTQQTAREVQQQQQLPAGRAAAAAASQAALQQQLL